MTTETFSGMVSGIEGIMITVQADISDGLPVFNMVGLLASEVREAKERVRTAFKNTDLRLPPKRISVNLAPADQRKRGTGFDLAIAVALLVAMGRVDQEAAGSYLFLGELALDGTITRIQGTLPILHEALRRGFTRCVIPEGNVREAQLLTGLEIHTFENLYSLYVFLSGKSSNNVKAIIADGNAVSESSLKRPVPKVDFSQIRGQKLAKRALTIAVAGFHHLFLDGPPGVGKSMLAEAAAGILPDMSREEIIETTIIYSVRGLLGEEGQWIGHRPFRNPGHAVTKTGIFGGGRDPRPGEISLAHHGVLFLDEFTEYKQDILEMMRLPLEEHRIMLVRNERTIVYPADFLLIAASNPCPCGYYPDRRLCRCTPQQVQRYQSKLSGPVLDRMDLFVRCDPMDYRTFAGTDEETPSAVIRSRVMEARERQKHRFDGEKGYFNGRMGNSDIRRLCRLTERGNRLLERAFDVYHLSGRSVNRILKVARTIADLEGKADISEDHLTEAILFRRFLPEGRQGGMA